MSQSVIVIGGGVIGTACAYYLNRSGWDVTIIDQKTIGSGASHANCGYVSPSHILPLCRPGVLGTTIKAMFSSNSPFSIKPRLDPALWSWLIQFARHCNQRDMLAGGLAIQSLLNSSRSLYDQLFADEAIEAEWQTRGLLFTFLTPAAMDHFEHTDQLLGDHFGLRAKRYDGDAVCQLEPALKSGLAGGWHYEADAHLRPDKLMSSWRSLLESRGVVIRENCDFRGFVTANGQATKALTGDAEFSADAFVVATGAWTPKLKQHLGCNIPIQPGKGYSMTMARPTKCPVIPLMFEEHRVAVTPMLSGYRLGSIMEFAGYDTSLHPSRMELLRAGARHYLHEPTAEPIVEQWYGWRPMTPDSLPIIDRSPVLNNVLIAAGHNMLGLSMAPGTGKLVDEILSGGKPEIDPKPYCVRRFYTPRGMN